ncbi:hypothetical protein [Streptomyces sp. NPDC048309]|uniref:hypothetical protein n=1 Tax=unclassified Streptomyces TaxID=2593676 RepID=UPI0033F632E2
MGTDEHVCPECGQPVATVVRRHKTLGAWVPHWGPGPCRNPKCEAYVGESTAQSHGTHGTPGTHSAHDPHGTHGAPGEPGERVGEKS